MATTKKTVKSDATDKKKTATSKKTTNTKKKTTVKKEVESTGVVDEFLNENIGKVVTEAPKPEAETATEPKTEKPEAVVTTEEQSHEQQQNVNVNAEANDENDDEVKSNQDIDEDIKEKLEELGLTNELQVDIQKTVTDLYNTDTTIEVVAENDKPKDVVYPPIVNNIEPQEKQKTPTADDLKVNLQANPQQKFTYVNISMGVKYD